MFDTEQSEAFSWDEVEKQSEAISWVSRKRRV